MFPNVSLSVSLSGSLSVSALNCIPRSFSPQILAVIGFFVATKSRLMPENGAIENRLSQNLVRKGDLRLKSNEESERGSITKPNDGKRRKVRSPGDYSLGDVVDRLSERDWRILIDLYLCRCMPQSVLVDTFFLDSPNDYYKGYVDATPSVKGKMEEKNGKRALLKARRKMWDLFIGGLIEHTSILPNEIDKPIHSRTRIRGETWYYLTGRGLRIVEVRIGVLEESRLSKLELDMERAKKEHFWELGKVYLDLRYKFMADIGARQFKDWDWHPALTVYADKNSNLEIRPDAVFRLQEQVFYVELDRSTEPIQRSPFMTDQISIVSKLKRYRDVINSSKDVPLQQNGIIAFIVPDAIYESRLKNIQAAGKEVWPNDPNRVIVGRTIGDVFEQRFKSANKGGGSNT